MKARRPLQALAIGLTILLIPMTVSAGHNTETTRNHHGEGHLEPCINLDECTPDPWVEDIDPCRIIHACIDEPPQIDPWVEANIQFELKNCRGVKEKITEDETTVGGGLAKGGPVFVLFAFATFKTKDHGWSWQFTCTLEFTEDVYAEGGGSVMREVAIYADTPSKKNRAEANCHYNGITKDYCRTPTIVEKGDTYTITAQGHTNGYPTDFSAESKAVAKNKPADSEEFCLNHHACLAHDGVWATVDAREAEHAPVKSDNATIAWSSAKDTLALIADLPVPEILDPDQADVGLP